MTQTQAVHKYGIPRDIICKVIKLAKVQPTGTVPGVINIRVNFHEEIKANKNPAITSVIIIIT